MAGLFEHTNRVEPADPVLVVALDGWIDAGYAAATARTTLRENLDLVTVGAFDADVLLDHRARRPTVHLVDGVNTGLTWPTIELASASPERGPDLLLLQGPEPDHLWRAFAAEVAELALTFGVRQVVGLGAYPAPVPHTRATRVVSTATSPDVARQIGFVPGRVDVPGGVAAAIERAAAEVGLPAVGLWAQVPHYAAAMPYPAGAVALLDALDRTIELQIPPGSLVAEAEATRIRIDELVAANPDHRAMVDELETQHDAAVRRPASDEDSSIEPVSGEELAAELERFLRDQGPS